MQTITWSYNFSLLGPSLITIKYRHIIGLHEIYTTLLDFITNDSKNFSSLPARDPKTFKAMLPLMDNLYITTMLKLQRQPIKVAFSFLNLNIVIYV